MLSWMPRLHHRGNRLGEDISWAATLEWKAEAVFGSCVERADIPGVSRAATVDRGEGRAILPAVSNPLGLGGPDTTSRTMSGRRGSAANHPEDLQEAAAGSTVGGEAPPVFAYYFHQCGRDDCIISVLSDAHRETLPPSTFW